MNLYGFQVQGAGDKYRLYVEAENEVAARKKVADIVPKGRSVALFRWHPGTLREFLGEEHFARSEKKMRAQQKTIHYKGEA